MTTIDQHVDAAHADDANPANITAIRSVDTTVDSQTHGQGNGNVEFGRPNEASMNVVGAVPLFLGI